MKKKAMKKMAMKKVLSCFVIIAILMSAMSVSVFAMNDSNNVTSNASDSSNETFLEKAFGGNNSAEVTMPFLTNNSTDVQYLSFNNTVGEDNESIAYDIVDNSNGKTMVNNSKMDSNQSINETEDTYSYQETSSNEIVSALGGQIGECASVVKFKGTATNDENKGIPSCYGSYYCKVKVEELLSNPGNRLKSGNEYIVCYGDSPKNIKTEDKLEVYGEYFQTCGPFQYVGNIIAFKSDYVEFDNDYYIKKIGSSESLSIDVWTDKSEYKIGDIVTIYYKTNKKCNAKLTITKPDGGKVVYGPNEIPACTRSKSPTAGYPTGKRTVVFETWAGDEYKKATCYFDVVEEKKPKQPAPEIIKVIYPSTCVKEGEYATISVTVKNNGGPTSEGYISVSFPHDEYIPRSSVTGTGNGYNKLYQKSFWPIWNSKGEQMTAVDPLVELYDTDWKKDQQEIITMKAKPNSGSDKIVFYVRAALKNDADGSYERDPSYSGDKDQQGWCVKKYSVDVCEYEEVKFKGKILADHQIISFYSFDVKIDEVLDDPTGNLQEGETVNVLGHRSGPAQVDDVTVEDEVEVFGEYRGYGGTYEQIFLSDWDESSSDHYVKKIEEKKTGSLKVTIYPSEVRSNARWKLTSGPDTNWHSSGYTITNIPVGSYTIRFKDVSGLNKPSDKTATITEKALTINLEGIHRKRQKVICLFFGKMKLQIMFFLLVSQRMENM